ncbi:hypothetical protein [Exiguobacterium antarcticum]|nr:hypothetical protein [Exiguobacterium antarcticum]
MHWKTALTAALMVSLVFTAGCTDSDSAKQPSKIKADPQVA